MQKNSSSIETIIVMGASFETPNQGVSALATGALAGIVDRFPGAKIVFADYSKFERNYLLNFPDSQVHAELLPLRFSWRLWLPNNIFFLLLIAVFIRYLPVRIRAKAIDQNRSLREISNARSVFALNGGDSFSDIYGIPRFLYVTLPLLLTLQLKVPLILLPQTYGPYRRQLSRIIAQYILLHSSSIYSRDTQGCGAVRELTNGAKSARFSHDVAFVMPAMPPSQKLREDLEAIRSSTGCLVGLNISGLLWIGGYRSNNDFGTVAEYRELIVRIVETLSEQEAYVMLIPHVFGSDGESDIVAIESYVSKLTPESRQKVFVTGPFRSPTELKWAIGKCDFFIGSRMHACIAALSQGVPAVGLAYSDKFYGVFQSVDAQDLVVDLRKSGIDETIQSIVGKFRQKETFRKRLSRVLPRSIPAFDAAY